MSTKIITIAGSTPAESTGADVNKGAPLNAAEFDQNLVNLRAAIDRRALKSSAEAFACGALTASGLIETTFSTANTISALLGHNPYDVNFCIGAAVGANSGSSGAEMHRFGSFYNGTGWDSYTIFKRGSGANNGSMVLCAANTEIATISSNGLAVTGTIGCSSSTPASASAAGVAGTITWDSSYVYVCTATNTWKRAAIATW